MDLHSNPLDHDACYAAIAARDTRFDGLFFTAVHSTGIYCRPGCPARTPSSKGVTFYRSAAAASGEGYRPCLRCRPETAPGSRAWMGNEHIALDVHHRISQGALDDRTVESLAADVGLSARQLRRVYHRYWGCTPVEAAQVRRLHVAKQLLHDTNLAVTDVAFAAGFGSLRRFNALTRQRWGVAPSLFRRRVRTGVVDSASAITLRLDTRPPFDWDHVLAFLSQRALPGVERVADGRYSRVISIDGKLGTIAAWLSGPARLTVRVPLEFSPQVGAILRRLRQLFDLDANPRALQDAWCLDDSDDEAAGRLCELVRRWPGTRVPGVWDAFEVVVRAVLGQQISVAAARTLVTRFVARFGEPTGSEGPLTHAFPAPSVVATGSLDGLGITGRRIDTIRAVAERFADQRLDFSACYTASRQASQRKELLSVTGIGPWTADYIEMRGLANPNAFPAGDLILRRSAIVGDELTEKQLREYSASWAPWRAYAAILLWRDYADRLVRKKESRCSR